MNIKQVTVLTLILLFMLVPIALAADGDFTIPSVVKDITVNDDGSTVIIEEITYDIEGSVNGVYRDIPLTGDQTITNVSVKTPGYYNKLERDYSDYGNIKVWLYTDAARTQKTKNAKVTVIYNYTINKGVKIYNDIAELQYMTWGDDWDSKVDHMESTIHIPGSKDNTQNWNNPEDNVVSSQWTSSDTLTTKLDNIGANTSFEQRIIMPKDYFKSTFKAQRVNMDAKDQIIEDQRKYREEQDKEKMIGNIIWAVMGIFLIIPFGVYAYYGREPKIDYNAEYEYDIPTDLTPLQVHALMESPINYITDDGLSATILDLIDRRYFKVVVNDATKTIIRQTEKDTADLKEHELEVIKFLSSYAQDGDISIGYVGNRAHKKDFRNFWSSWEKKTKKEVPDSLVKRYFVETGAKIHMALVLVSFLMVIITIIISFANLVPSKVRWILAIAVFFFLIEGIVLICISDTVLGRWTPEGREVYEKWKNFKKYLTDYSLIEERPPASVQIWGRYLVYATALGCAREVTRNMKNYYASIDATVDIFEDSNAASFVYYGGLSDVNSSINTLSASDYESDSSGVGSSGSGGFGGGGGGTF